jgi:fructose-1,6-bisphosphatase/inositol monophosphatase family enzyme
MSLKLLANDADDLKIIASALQDAILRVGDIRYDPVARSVSLRMTRFRHEAKKAERVECGVRIDGVSALQSRGIERGKQDAFMVVLDLTVELTDAPAGYLDITLAGGGVLRLTIEGLDLMLSDVGEGRMTRAKPDHGTA